jgi:hypothetical protein
METRSQLRAAGSSGATSFAADLTGVVAAAVGLGALGGDAGPTEQTGHPATRHWRRRRSRRTRRRLLLPSPASATRCVCQRRLGACLAARASLRASLRERRAVAEPHARVRASRRLPFRLRDAERRSRAGDDFHAQDDRDDAHARPSQAQGQRHFRPLPPVWSAPRRANAKRLRSHYVLSTLAGCLQPGGRYAHFARSRLYIGAFRVCCTPSYCPPRASHRSAFVHKALDVHRSHRQEAHADAVTRW